MLCEKILGNLKDSKYQGKTVEYVEIDWHDAYHKIHSKTTKEGTEVGIRLDNDVLTNGLRRGDVLYEDDEKVIAVQIPACEAIVASIKPHHEKMIAKLCYEIGNRHATLFWGEEENTFVTPYNEPMLTMIQKIHGVTAEVKTIEFDFDKAISSSINAHAH